MKEIRKWGFQLAEVNKLKKVDSKMLKIVENMIPYVHSRSSVRSVSIVLSILAVSDSMISARSIYTPALRYKGLTWDLLHAKHVLFHWRILDYQSCQLDLFFEMSDHCRIQNNIVYLFQECFLGSCQAYSPQQLLSKVRSLHSTASEPSCFSSDSDTSVVMACDINWYMFENVKPEIN